MIPLTRIDQIPLGSIIRIGVKEGPLRHWRSEPFLHGRQDPSIVDPYLEPTYRVLYEVLIGNDLMTYYDQREVYVFVLDT